MIGRGFPKGKKGKKEKVKRPKNVKLIRINDKTEVYLDADIPEEQAGIHLLEYLSKTV